MTLQSSQDALFFLDTEERVHAKGEGVFGAVNTFYH